MAYTFYLEQPKSGSVIGAKLGTDTIANSGHLNDNDVGKPLKYAADGRMVLCSDGDSIDGFLLAVDAAPQDGYAFGSVLVGVGEKVKVTCDGAITYGAFVEAAAPAAARTAETAGYGKVSAHTAAAADTSRWRLIGGTGTTATTAIIYKVF